MITVSMWSNVTIARTDSTAAAAGRDSTEVQCAMKSTRKPSTVHVYSNAGCIILVIFLNTGGFGRLSLQLRFNSSYYDKQM